MSDSKLKAPAELKKLDRDRPYATVHPALGNAHFHQDGLYFDHIGRLVTEDTVCPESGKKIELFGADAQKKLKRLAALEVANQAKRDALIAAGINPDDEDLEAAEGDESQVEKFDFVGWLRGERKVQWFVVKQALKDEFGRNVQNQKEAVAFLVVDQGLLDPDQVKIS
jgi:hypothetical protein